MCVLGVFMEENVWADGPVTQTIHIMKKLKETY